MENRHKDIIQQSIIVIFIFKQIGMKFEQAQFTIIRYSFEHFWTPFSLTVSREKYHIYLEMICYPM